MLYRIIVLVRGEKGWFFGVHDGSTQIRRNLENVNVPKKTHGNHLDKVRQSYHAMIGWSTSAEVIYVANKAPEWTI